MIYVVNLPAVIIYYQNYTLIGQLWPFQLINSMFIFQYISQYVLDIISEASNPRANLSLVRTLMRLVSTIKQTNSIRFIKVPGHANVLENELVDFLAKRGAKGSTSSEAPPNQLFRRAYREALSKSYTSPFIPVECPQLY